ncbi:Protein-tyrosine phosphatase, low molecular weight, mammalian,Phosphotyrosine protein phosphatase I [Cinara cedri]|uniref:Low molecular weight phosphotyrosine protein phosphatase n=1 Tax=Cinara cedri TaxID=506608 RepID=A0A5E4N2F8_9HEMI|nr:Protein-tyrosine phosphatase, low molecular weight, mammalian,Phosphotyrosine protein phosphatase I [Cinara cedri]
MGEIRSVLFVCLGNICRSPMAEAVFIEAAKQKGVANKWHAESAGTAGYHVGCSPDERTISVLRKNGIQFEHSAKQLVKEDFYTFNFIFGMDKSNMDNINRIKPKDSKAQVLLLGSFDPEGDTIIRDPYYDNDNRGFEKCFQQCMRSCKSFLDKNK